ncbi:hypothetical protein KAR91_70680 [Candidatus Pacearchaeota archaeon]|nr:hypothetical protein [Candidatus Pacearchaeota archaeon]
MKTLLFALIILAASGCSPRIQSRGSANEMIVVLSITDTGDIELKAQGDFTILVEYMKVDSLILLHISGTTAQVVNQKDLKLLKGLIYQSGHDN